MSPCAMIPNGGAMSNDILTLGDALNYLGIIGGLVAVVVAVAVAGASIGERYGRAACKRRHPASMARRAEIIASRRRQLDRRA